MYRIETGSVLGLMCNCVCEYYFAIVYELWKKQNK